MPLKFDPKRHRTLEDLPNIGPRIAADLRRLGVKSPESLRGKDAVQLYRALEKKAWHRQDPCVLDTFMAVIDFVSGAPARPWWKYTAERKRLIA